MSKLSPYPRQRIVVLYYPYNGISVKNTAILLEEEITASTSAFSNILSRYKKAGTLYTYSRAKGERAWKRQSFLKTIHDAEGGLSSTSSSSKDM